MSITLFVCSAFVAFEMRPYHATAAFGADWPYAVVLGGKDRWLQAMVQADDDVDAPDPTAIDWYHAPATWHLQDLPVSLTPFISTVQGVLFGR